MTTHRHALALALLAAAPLSAEDRPDILVAAFETETYGDWTATGTAFGTGPARGTLPGQMAVTGFEGERLVNSFLEGDDSTGTLIGLAFTVERKHINFLVGGGKYPGETCVNLLLDGEVVRTATGPNDRPGGSEALDWTSWDVADLAGKTVKIQIVDQRKGGWGHINVDQIVQSDRPKQAGPATREIIVTKRYLHLPVKNGQPKVRMKVSVGDTIVDEFTIELAPEEPDFWVFLDVGRFQGKAATVNVDRLPAESKALSAITQADEVPSPDTLYGEKYRPQFHFTSRRGWNNDPNGLVYHEGTWHLYYQHNPYGWGWGNMHWGHAVSEDLAHWKELPTAIYPYRFDDWAFSGGALVDHENTAGFQKGDEKVIVASYTSTGRGECLAYSNDGGLTFTDYENNPVIKHQGRDPKIIWYAPGKHWVMAVYDEREAEGDKRVQCIAFYTSTDLKDWTRTSQIDGYYECPEIYELPVDGDENDTRWVVYAADGAYAIGSFDGKIFTPEHEGKHRFDWGDCFYASQTYSDVPESDGRRIQIAWGRTGHPSMPFNQQMNFPVTLTLRETEDGIRQFANPVREIEGLHDRSHSMTGVKLSETENPLSKIEGELFHVVADIELGEAREVTFTVRGLPVVYDVAKGVLTCKGQSAPLKPEDGRIRLEMLADRLSLEIFGNGGRVYMPIAAPLADGPESLSLHATGDGAVARTLAVHTLKSIWHD